MGLIKLDQYDTFIKVYARFKKIHEVTHQLQPILPSLDLNFQKYYVPRFQKARNLFCKLYEQIQPIYLKMTPEEVNAKSSIQLNEAEGFLFLVLVKYPLVKTHGLETFPFYLTIRSAGLTPNILRGI